MFSVLVYKATRGAQRLVHGLKTMDEAIEVASQWYDNAQVFVAAKLLDSGVSMFVMTDEDAALIDGKGIILVDTKKVLFQAGGY